MHPTKCLVAERAGQNLVNSVYLQAKGRMQIQQLQVTKLRTVMRDSVFIVEFLLLIVIRGDSKNGPWSTVVILLAVNLLFGRHISTGASKTFSHWPYSRGASQYYRGSPCWRRCKDTIENLAGQYQTKTSYHPHGKCDNITKRYGTSRNDGESRNSLKDMEKRSTPKTTSFQFPVLGVEDVRLHFAFLAFVTNLLNEPILLNTHT